MNVAMETLHGEEVILGLDLGFSLEYDRAVLGEIMFCLLIDDDLFRGGFLDFVQSKKVKKIERNVGSEALSIADG